MNDYLIRKINPCEVKQAMDLVLEVFMEFEAPDYAQTGVDSFKRDIVNNESYLESVKNGSCPIYAAFDGSTMIGLIGMRSCKTHINLVFTKKEYHRQGVATSIFNYLLSDVLSENKELKAITLNSSPYGLPFYLHLGFEAMSDEQEIDGIRFTPMKYTIK